MTKTKFLFGVLCVFAWATRAQIGVPPKSPEAEKIQPIIPNKHHSIGQPTTNTFRSPPDISTSQDHQNHLKEVYREISPPDIPPSSPKTITYDLPSCSAAAGTFAYRHAFDELNQMAAGQKAFKLKNAIFLVENAFLENKGSLNGFELAIQQIKLFLNWKKTELNQDPNSNLAKNLLLFRFISDTLAIKSKNLTHYPFKYDFEDYRGEKDWSSMFVSKTLLTHSGQCHSLPLLYLILADAIGAKAHLAYSPNHTYIKFQDDDGKWHNLELTSGMLTTDAFVLQSGYIKAEALQNRIYMQPLTDKQLLSYCLFDLAQGYSVKYCYDQFVKMVIDKALELDPTNIHAQMLKADYLTIQFNHISRQLDMNASNYREIITQYPQAKHLLFDRNQQYQKIDDLGYEPMPAEAYQKWLNSLNEAKHKQQSQVIFQGLDKKLETKNINLKK